MPAVGAKKEDLFKAYAAKQKKLKKDGKGSSKASATKPTEGKASSTSDEAARKKAEYLKKYMSAGGGDDSGDGGEKKKRKKKRPKGGAVGAGMRIIDEDFDWKKDSSEVKLMTLDGLDMGEEGPVVVNHEEMKLQMALERSEKVLDEAAPDAEAKFIRTDHRDGSGWSDEVKAKVEAKDSDGDQSPPRRGRQRDSDGDQSPPRRKRMDSDEDQSPPRRKRMDSDEDQSPPRRKRMDSDDDQSPPRRKRNDSDSDQSPPRKRVDSDSGQSPPRRGAKGGSDSDQSPVRKKVRTDSDSDQSPPRKGDKDGAADKPEQRKGLRTKEDFAAEAKLVNERKQAALAKMGEESGAGAATIVRDETGRKLTQEEIEAKIKARTEQDVEPEMEWGTGIVQKQERERRAREAMHEKDKSFATTVDDGAMNDMLRAQDRWGDPMLEQVKKNAERKERISALKSDVVREKRPMFKGDAFPNRFGIRPGYRWDGIDRSTGWEGKIVQTGIAKTARDNEAQMWNTADM
jgi:pre-mRNA-splicing factor CWC26